MATSVGALAASSVLPTAPPPASPAAAPGGSATSASADFTALPSSYAGFGTDGSAVGTVGIVKNALAIIPAAASKSSDPPADPPADPPSVSLSQITTIGKLADVNERIAFADAQGNSAAAQQLQPYAVQLNAQLQYQPFAGLGITPQQPFAQPAIAPVFLNIAA